jgi:myosin heavy subunit
MSDQYVYILDKDYAWIPALLVDQTKETSTVSILEYRNESEITGSNNVNDDNGRQQKKKTVTVQLKDYPNGALPLQNVSPEGSSIHAVQDMIELAFLHEAAILYNLKHRHVVESLPYTRTGDIVIAVNPYKWIHHLYTEQNRTLYSRSLVWEASQKDYDPRKDLPPHVYETSALAYKGLAHSNTDQSILVSGESGAGKTETVKICMNHLASVVQRDHSNDSSMEQDLTVVKKVLDSNPLLEAFGNAKTRRNDNSSRFGKYVQLQFDRRGGGSGANDDHHHLTLKGSECQVYLLEKSRVIRHDGSCERTFHIFYQLLAAKDSIKCQFWDQLRGKKNTDFVYVGPTDTTSIEGVADAVQFDKTLQSLAVIGIEGPLLKTFMQTICIVLQLGNLTFGPDPTDHDHAITTSRQSLSDLADLMGIPTTKLESTLTKRVVKVRSEETSVPLSPEAAKESTDALAKQIYDRSFFWLVRVINRATTAGDEKFGIIGLLDIFGFESFPVNSFEQLCINYANEQLQAKFTKDVFVSVYAEYNDEGISLDEIKYDDNTHVLDLIQNKTGLLAMLNEECIRPNGSDYGFVNKALHANEKSPALFIPRIKRSNVEFGIRHYAGDVLYDATNFVTKNQDMLPSDLMECAQTSTNEIIANEIGTVPLESTMPSSAGGGSRQGGSSNANKLMPRRKQSNLVAPTAWSKYKGSLSTLMANLYKSQSRYIRCVKPNSVKKPAVMEHDLTLQQLRSSGVISAVTLARSAFPNRLEHAFIMDRFYFLFPPGHARPTGDDGYDPEIRRKESEILLTYALKELEDKDGVKAFVLGRTRAYFRGGSLEYLEAARFRGMEIPATTIQAAYRGYLARTKAERVKFKAQMELYDYFSSRATVIQAAWRGAIARDFAEELRMEAREESDRRALEKYHGTAATVIQSQARVWLAQKERDMRYVLLIKAQAKALKKQKKQKKLDKAATKIQKHLRGTYIRNRYSVVIEKAKERANLKQKVDKIKRKIAKSKKSLDKELDKAKHGIDPDRLIGRQIWEEALLDADDHEIELSETAKVVEYLQSEHRQLKIKIKTMDGMLKPLKKNFDTLMDENKDLREDFQGVHAKNEKLKQSNKELVTKRETAENRIKELKSELEEISAKFAPVAQGRMDFHRALHEILQMVQDRCRDDRLIDDVMDIGYQAQSEARDLQVEAGATYEVDLQSSPTQIKRRFGSASPGNRTPTSASSSRSKVGAGGRQKLKGSPAIPALPSQVPDLTPTKPQSRKRIG